MHPKHSCHGRQLSRESPWDHHNQRPFVSSLLPRGLARLRANTKTRELCIHELLFADDAAIVAHTLEDIKEICKHFEQAATLFRLTISTKKTVTFHQPPPGQTSTSPHIEIYVTPLKSVNNFTYLASTVAFDNTIDMEINNRIRAASGAFGGFWKRVWSQHGIAISTKCKVYKAVVLPTLLYSAEMYTLYRRHIRKLSQVHLRHLRQILRISWKDHISNIVVLRQANMSSIKAILTVSQLHWTGHVTRMSSDRLPKAVFYGELSSGKCLRVGQRLRYKDVLKIHLKTTYIPVNTWEPIAHDRQKWRRAIHQGKIHIEEKLTKKYQHEHNRQHGLLGASILTVFCDDCGRGFVAQMGLNSHRRAKHKDTPLHWCHHRKRWTAKKKKEGALLMTIFSRHLAYDHCYEGPTHMNSVLEQQRGVSQGLNFPILRVHLTPILLPTYF